MGYAVVSAHVWVTYLGDRGANCPGLVTLPLHGALHPSNVTSNVVCYSSSPLRRHKTSWAEHSTKFWSDRTKETRYAEDSSRIVTPTDNLGERNGVKWYIEANSRVYSRRLRGPAPQQCELPLVWLRPPGDLRQTPGSFLPTGISSLVAKSDDPWVSSFPLA